MEVDGVATEVDGFAGGSGQVDGLAFFSGCAASGGHNSLRSIKWLLEPLPHAAARGMLPSCFFGGVSLRLMLTQNGCRRRWP